MNDDVKVHTGRLIREAGLTTSIGLGGEAYSGGVDLMLGPKGRGFYFFTLRAAPAQGMHTMSREEIEGWGVATEWRE